MRKTLATLTVAFAANTGYAHDQANCRDISNLLARLSCYDESHSGAAQSSSATRTNIRASGDTSPMPPASVASPSQPQTADSSFGEPRPMFSNRDTSTLSAALTKVVKQARSTPRLHLDNEQIWTPTKDRTMSASAGDSVKIKTGTIGGYLMSINDGPWFRVKRVD